MLAVARISIVPIDATDHSDIEMQTLKTLLFLEGVKTELSKKTSSQGMVRQKPNPRMR